MNYIDCKSVRDKILEDVKSRNPGNLKLVIIQVEGDDASEVYIKNKIKTAESVGIDWEVIRCSNDITYEDLALLIGYHNNLSIVTGVMLQLPLPDHLKDREQDLLDCISWYKDVDGLSTESVGRLWSDLPCIVPATPGGIMHLLPEDLSGKNVTIVNRSKLIGRPLTKLSLDRNATVNVCHSKTKSLYNHTQSADIVITGIGKPLYFFDLHFGKNQKWIDCGINRDENGKLCGDTDFGDFIDDYDRISVTPVPGGVGILTTAQLMLNVIRAYELQKEAK